MFLAETSNWLRKQLNKSQKNAVPFVPISSIVKADGLHTTTIQGGNFGTRVEQRSTLLQIFLEAVAPMLV
jgi:hypothetical protein